MCYLPSMFGSEFIFDYHNGKQKKQETIYAIQCTVIQSATEFDMNKSFFDFLKSGLSKNIFNSTEKYK